ncbi:MAG: DUF934 domain-containing protein [Pseudomonadota bacterium]
MPLLRLDPKSGAVLEDNGGMRFVPFEDIADGIENGEKVAVAISVDTDVADLLPVLSSLSAVSLDFPAFNDGRAFSQASLLRERYAYDGIIVARGDLLSDLAQFMLRCGITHFAVEGAEAVQAEYSAALGSFSERYQSSVDGTETIPEKRLTQGSASNRSQAAA